MKYGDKYRLFSVLTTDSANEMVKKAADRIAAEVGCERPATVVCDVTSQDQVDAFCNALQLFRLGYSWGGPISLVVPYELASMRTGWPAHLERGTLHFLKQFEVYRYL